MVISSTFDDLQTHRILLAYYRYDAAQMLDEEADSEARGKMGESSERDPCKAIRPEDDELLRYLAGAAPSKILTSSRLVPRVLLNQASQPIPGVLRERLPGLRPADAEDLLRSCGISGDSAAIRASPGCGWPWMKEGSKVIAAAIVSRRKNTRCWPINGPGPMASRKKERY